MSSRGNVKRKTTSDTMSLRAQRSTLCDQLSFAGAEAYKMLRANLVFALADDKKCHIVGVTSSVRNEGKSTTAINLSYTLAETGKRVLLIDADMRLPSVARKMGLKGTPGLSNVLAGMVTVNECIQKPLELAEWRVMPSGDVPPNPSELLASEKMHKLFNMLSAYFDYIIVDLPPVNLVSDALSATRWMDGVLVVVREGFSEKKVLAECQNQLQLQNARILGFVLTDSESSKSRYGSYGDRKEAKKYD